MGLGAQCRWGEGVRIGVRKSGRQVGKKKKKVKKIQKQKDKMFFFIFILIKNSLEN